MSDKALELLKRARYYLGDVSPVMVQPVYIPPAQAMRNAANEMEQEDALIREIDEFLAENNTFPTI